MKLHMEVPQQHSELCKSPQLLSYFIPVCTFSKHLITASSYGFPEILFSIHTHKYMIFVFASCFL